MKHTPLPSVYYCSSPGSGTFHNMLGQRIRKCERERESYVCLLHLHITVAPWKQLYVWDTFPPITSLSCPYINCFKSHFLLTPVFVPIILHCAISGLIKQPSHWTVEFFTGFAPGCCSSCLIHSQSLSLPFASSETLPTESVVLSGFVLLSLVYSACHCAVSCV